VDRPRNGLWKERMESMSTEGQDMSAKERKIMTDEYHALLQFAMNIRAGDLDHHLFSEKHVIENPAEQE
jgi:hypothetical protein